MAGLLDISPVAPERVKLWGSEVEVWGIGAEGVVRLLLRFPFLKVYFLGGDKVDVDDLVKAAPEAVAAIIAAGCGCLGNEAQEGEEIASRLCLEEQIDALGAVIRATMPSGPGPFVEKLEAVGIAVSREESPEKKSPDSPQP